MRADRGALLCIEPAFGTNQQRGGAGVCGKDGGVVFAHRRDYRIAVRQVAAHRRRAGRGHGGVAGFRSAEAADPVPRGRKIEGNVRAEIAGRAEDENAHRFIHPAQQRPGRGGRARPRARVPQARKPGQAAIGGSHSRTAFFSSLPLALRGSGPSTG